MIPAIDESRLVDPIPADLMCGICWKLVLHPMECIHCDKIFCKDCLDLAKRSCDKCPMCRNKMNVKPMNRIVKETHYDTMKIRCINAPDCSVIGAVTIVLDHEKVCPEKVIKCLQCPDDDDEYTCGMSVKIKDYQTHLEDDCRCKWLTCSYCSEELIACDMYSHEQNNCPNFIHTCDLCNAYFTRNDDHESICPMVEVTCPVSGCFYKCMRRNLKLLHYADPEVAAQHIEMQARQLLRYEDDDERSGKRLRYGYQRPSRGNNHTLHYM